MPNYILIDEAAWKSVVSKTFKISEDQIVGHLKKKKTKNESSEIR